MKRLVMPVTAAIALLLVHSVNDTIAQVAAPPGRQFEASVTVRSAVDLEGSLLLPSTPGDVRATIAVVRWGLGGRVFNDPAWRQLADDGRYALLLFSVANSGPEAPRPVADQAVRNAAIGGADGLLSLLEHLARESGHAELQDTKFLLWGHSAAGSFAATFAGLHAGRTIGIIRYHSHSRGLPLDLKALAHIPTLIFAGEKDEIAGVQDGEALWRSGRALQAPWAFALEPGVPHASLPALARANELAIPWAKAVIALRTDASSAALRAVDFAAGWLANSITGRVAPTAAGGEPELEASWLPDESSARGWRLVSGFQR